MSEVNGHVQIKNEADKNIYPKTFTNLVFNEETGESLDDTLSSILNSIGIPPADMSKFTARNNGNSVRLDISLPNPTVIDGQRVCTPAGVVIKRSSIGYITDIADGTLVANLSVEDLKTPYIDTNLKAGSTYYYTAFPYSDHGAYNLSASELNKTATSVEDFVCYGFNVDQRTGNDVPDDLICENSNPAYTISNTGFKDGRMNFDKDTFDYGSWTGQEFIFPRSCMLKMDGTVDYYLNENDESLKEDGTASDYNNMEYEGNAMMEFGRDGKQIWTAFIADTDEPDITHIYVADKKIDDNFHAWAFNEGKANHFYFAKYFGSKDSKGRMRSISGTNNSYNTNASQEITMAKANGTGWMTGTKAQWDLLDILCWLITGTADSQTALGRGHVDTEWHDKYEGIEPGSMDGKGMFWGERTGKKGVKFLGIEHYFGNLWRRIAGWCQISSDKSTRIKLMKGTADGSTATDYNTTGDGYITLIDGSQAAQGYISKMKFDNRGFFYPIECKASTTTRYCDNKWTNADANTYAIVGCRWGTGSRGGSSGVDLDYAASNAYFAVGSSLSYTPETSESVA